MKNLGNKKFSFFYLLLVVLILVGFWVPTKSEASYPYIANYYLGELKTDKSFIQTLSKYDLLVLVPTQIKAHPGAVSQIKANNPDIIILAYVPSQSYNYQYWDSCSIFSKLKPIDDSWWLKDPSGKIVSHWTGIWDMNMSEGWTERLVDVTNKYILTLGNVDGIFFDMVSESISWINNGNIDMNGNGVKDSASVANNLWLNRTKYFLNYAKANLKTKYIIMNGSSNLELQPYVNGRMFENFPANNVNAWINQMKEWGKNKNSNLSPQITVINSNTANTGNQTNYKNMRFGLASALLEDGYFSFDFGDQNHGQTWWYDEYDVNLGDPLSAAKSKNNYTDYKADIWQRDFTNGIALLNSTGQKQTVSLGGEYEKIHGTQDRTVNDGSIITNTTIDGYDGLLLLKIVSSLNDVLFRNGDFVRFVRPDGTSVRNGFFIFENGYKGGDKIAHVDLDGNGKRDLLVVSGNKMLTWRDDGQPFMKVYPYTANYPGELNVSVGDLNKDGYYEVYVAPEAGYNYPIKIYTRHGRKMKRDWYPFGENYTGGYSLAIGHLTGTRRNDLVIAKQTGEPLVSVFDYNYNMAYQWFAFDRYYGAGVNVTSGNVDGIGLDELIVGAGVGSSSVVRVYDVSGKQLYDEIKLYSSLGKPGVEVLSADVDFDGKDDIIGMNGGF